MNQNKPLPRPPSYYFRPIYNKKDDKCKEEKPLDQIKLLKPQVRISSPYPETTFSKTNNTPSSNNLTSKL